MQRVIIDYKKLTKEILSLLTTKFPDGYGDDDIITFQNHKNETIDAVEVRTDETIYLVKIGKHLVDSMANIDLVDDSHIVAKSYEASSDIVIDKEEE